MAAPGSVAERRLLAEKPLKLPGISQDRSVTPLMTRDGWFGEWQSSGHQGGCVTRSDSFKSCLRGDIWRAW